MGVVYMCYDREYQRVLALKTLQDRYLDSKKILDSFKKEALAWIHLEKHPYIVRAFWVRECKDNWTREMDVPPARWFKDPLSQGPLKGMKLDRVKYDALLQAYYAKRGWDQHGVPIKETLEKLGLSDVAQQLNAFVGEEPAVV